MKKNNVIGLLQHNGKWIKAVRDEVNDVCRKAVQFLG